MAKAAHKPNELNIDLLPKEDSSKKPGDPIHWILTIGRYLIIVTEIIALGTFVFGIILSKQKNDLKESIIDNQRRVDELQKCNPNNLEEFCEERFLKVQTQLNQIATIRNNQNKNNSVLTEFVNLLPEKLTLESFSLTNNKITFSGKFDNEQQLQTLITSFNKSDKIINLDITNLVKDSGFTFSASAQVNWFAFKDRGAK
jgi:Tfp pilus assembly protein PilN